MARLTLARPGPSRSALGLLGWLLTLAFLAWAARLLLLEGYLYVAPGDFQTGDFPRTANLGSPEFWNGQGIFYGPIFVLEYRFMLAPRVLGDADFARLNFPLFGIAFACTWLATVGTRRPRLMLLALAAWLAHHSTVEAFAYTSHLEVLELAALGGALLLAVRQRPDAAGGLVGLAIATKTLPGLYLPYLALKRRWRMLAAACLVAGALLLVVCWLQDVTPWQGLVSLVYQGGNLTKLEYSEYEYSPRADLARILAEPDGSLTPEAAHLAIGFHFALALAALAVSAWVVARTRLGPRTYGLFFGVVAAVMLVASPSAHVHYYIFLLLTWTAMLGELIQRPLTRGTLGLWLALVAGYVFTGFDQPFFAAQRLLGVGLVVPEHWLSWHLPTLALTLTLGAALVALATTQQAPGSCEPRAAGGRLRRRVPA